MIQIQVDETELKAMYEQEIQKRLDRLEEEVTFWDVKELKRQTSMSWNTILKYFFHEPDFPKIKMGNKWYFPAKECRTFLKRWAEIQQYKFKNSKEAI